MLVDLLERNLSINPEYIVSLNIVLIEPKVIGGQAEYKVVAKMIDGSLVLLAKFNNLEEAESEYKRFKEEANKREVLVVESKATNSI